MNRILVELFMEWYAISLYVTWSKQLAWKARWKKTVLARSSKWMVLYLLNGSCSCCWCCYSYAWKFYTVWNEGESVNGTKVKYNNNNNKKEIALSNWLPWDAKNSKVYSWNFNSDCNLNFCSIHIDSIYFEHSNETK